MYLSNLFMVSIVHLYFAGKIILIGAHENVTKDPPSDDQSQSSSSPVIISDSEDNQSPVKRVIQKAKLGGSSKEPERGSEQGSCS